jgi:fatty-acyl-CoA synthase
MVNIRLHDDQLEHVVADAGDTVLFVDDDLVPRLAPLVDRLPSVRTFVRLGKGDTAGIKGILDAEALLVDAAPTALHDLPDLAEDDACGMCHTSGTTGMPKAVVYSHRSTYLHALTACTVDALGLSESERVLPVVPLFHACGWGLPYAAPLTGAELVLAGADTSPANLARIVETERVTWAAGVPTIWTGLLPLAQSGTGRPVVAADHRHRWLGDASALLEAYDALGIEIRADLGHDRDLTRRGGLPARAAGTAASAPEQLRAVRAKTGTVFAGSRRASWREDGASCPGTARASASWSAAARGCAPTTGAGAPEKFRDGWLRTGDMAGHGGRRLLPHRRPQQGPGEVRR